MIATAASAAFGAPPDLQLVERLYRETRAERELADPDWSSYVSTLIKALTEVLESVLVKANLRVSLWPRVAAWVLAAVSAALVAVVVYRLVVTMLKRRRTTESGSAGSDAGAPAVRRHLSSPAWRAEVEARLGRGEAAAALEAAWWWLATSLLAGEVDPAWTTRELLGVAGRRDLAPPARVLDRLLYGPERPRTQDVRSLVSDLEQALA